MLIPDTQQGVEFAVDADVDVLLRAGAGEMQPFHAGLRVLRDGSDGKERIVSCLGAPEWPNSDLTIDSGSQSGERSSTWISLDRARRRGFFDCFATTSGSPRIQLRKSRYNAV